MFDSRQVHISGTIVSRSFIVSSGFSVSSVHRQSMLSPHSVHTQFVISSSSVHIQSTFSPQSINMKHQSNHTSESIQTAPNQLQEGCKGVSRGVQGTERTAHTKGDTVVSPSDFQSETTRNPHNTGVSDHSTSCTPTHTPTRTLYVMIACEESQAECIAFRQLGHEAYSCDIQPCRPNGHPEWHIHADVTPLLLGETSFTTQDGTQHHVPHWDLIIAHPPCTYLCKVSSVHMVIAGQLQQDRYEKMLQARDFFFQCLNAKAPYVAVENPLPMKRACLPKPSCFIHPSWFGVKYTKKTLYWLRNLPPIMATLDHPNPKEFVRASRGKYRSRTFPQVAMALATQWSQYILDELLQNPE